MTNLDGLQHFKHLRHKRQQILKGVAGRDEHHDSKNYRAEILLVFEIAIDRSKGVEAGLDCSTQQFPVPCPGPPLLLNGEDLVPHKVRRELTRQLLIEQNAHGN